ncbi:sulfatase [Planctomycetota bacterium]
MIRYLTNLLVVIGVLCGAAAGKAPVNNVSNKPNIILFLIDDQDKENIAAYGGKTYTPHLDRMAAEGMKFTQAYVSSAVCTPSRYTFTTGRYAGNSTSKLYKEACGGPDRQGHPNFNMALERDQMNVGRVLRNAGYTTGWVGKVHLESELDFPEFYQGKDAFRTVPKQGLTADANSTALFAHNERVMRRYIENLGFSWAKHVYSGNMQSPYNHHNPEWTTEAALEFIEENQDRPFYLQYCSTLLHGGEGSWRKSMDFPLDSGAGQLMSLPTVMTPRKKLLQTLAEKGFDPDSPTAGEAWIDDALGAILKKLQQLDLDNNTLVLFAPDHGRRGKGSLFSQDGVNIPMIARWPGHIPPNSVCDALVQNVDWVPTVFDIAGITKPSAYRMNGQSFRPLLLGEQNATGRDHVYLEMGFARGIATQRWKYIAVRYPQEQIDVIKRSSLERLPKAMSYIGRLGIGIRGADHPGFWDGDQLYDLQADPGELNNLAANPEYMDQLQNMQKRLTEELLTSGRPFGEFVPGGNAAPGGQVDMQIAQVKTLTIKGKTVIVPTDSQSKDASSSRKETRKSQRRNRKLNP